MRFCIGWIFVDFFQAESEIQSLLREDVPFVAHFSVVMNDNGGRTEFQMLRKAGRIDDLMDGSAKSDLRRIAEEADQRIIDVAGIPGTFFIIVSICRPPDQTASVDVISLNQVKSVRCPIQRQIS